MNHTNNAFFNMFYLYLKRVWDNDLFYYLTRILTYIYKNGQQHFVSIMPIASVFCEAILNIDCFGQKTASQWHNREKPEMQY